MLIENSCVFSLLINFYNVQTEHKCTSVPFTLLHMFLSPSWLFLTISVSHRMRPCGTTVTKSLLGYTKRLYTDLMVRLTQMRQWKNQSYFFFVWLVIIVYNWIYHLLLCCEPNFNYYCVWNACGLSKPRLTYIPHIEHSTRELCNIQGFGDVKLFTTNY